MCSGSEAGSYLRPIDVVNHSTLGLSVIKKKKIKCSASIDNSFTPPRRDEIVFVKRRLGPSRAMPLRMGIHGGHVGLDPYRGTSLIRKLTPLGPYRRPMPRVLGGA